MRFPSLADLARLCGAPERGHSRGRLCHTSVCCRTAQHNIVTALTAAWMLTSAVPAPRQASAAPAPGGVGRALLVGVNRDLRYCGRDAGTLAETLVGKCGFRQDMVRVLRDDEPRSSFARPTQSAILAQLDWLLGSARPDERAVFFFSGHGGVVDGQGYLLPVDGDRSRPADTLVSMRDIRQRFERCRARQKLVFLDACHAGAALPGGTKAIGVAPAKTGAVLAQEFHGVGQGLMVIASCGPKEESCEHVQIGHGVFTYYALKGLAGEADEGDGQVQVGELYRYIWKHTSRHVADHFRKQQNPCLFGFQTGPFVLASAPGGRRPVKAQPAAGATGSRTVVTLDTDGAVPARTAFLRNLERELVRRGFVVVAPELAPSLGKEAVRWRDLGPRQWAHQVRSRLNVGVLIQCRLSAKSLGVMPGFDLPAARTTVEVRVVRTEDGRIVDSDTLAQDAVADTPGAAARKAHAKAAKAVAAFVADALPRPAARP